MRHMRRFSFWLGPGARGCFFRDGASNTGWSVEYKPVGGPAPGRTEMKGKQPKGTIILGVGAVIWNERREVLLVRRSNPPRQNEWSLPGGRVEFGETLRAAIVREVREETRIAIEIVGLVDVAELVLDETTGAAGNH